MTLATHMLVAGATTRILGIVSPAGGFAIGVATHYLIDAIPHYDIELASISKPDKSKMDIEISLKPQLLLLDAARVLGDALVGVLFLFAAGAFSPTSALLLAAAAGGGILPDIFQYVYGLVKCPPFTWTQRFHNLWHATRRLGRTAPAIGAQVAIGGVAVLLLILTRPPAL